MVNADPKRTPTFTFFGNSDFFFQASNPTACGTPTLPTCVDPKFAWNHGDFQDEIANTWLGMVGPGVARNGVDSKTWTDHVDIRPTINSLVGLSDSYEDDGRVITQLLGHGRAATTQGEHGDPSTQLGDAYKQLNAPFGSFGLDTLVASTAAISVDRRAEVRLDRDADREPDRQARRARGNDPRSAQRRGGGRRQDQRRPGARLDEAGAEPDRSGARAGCCFIAGEVLRSRRARARAMRRARALRRRASRSGCGAAASRGARRPRTCASPAGCVPRGSSARSTAPEMRRTCAGAVLRAVLVELHAVGELAQDAVGRLLPELGDVDLVDLVLRMREPVREVAVVREQDRAGRVGVEAADGNDARRVVDEPDDGRATLAGRSPSSRHRRACAGARRRAAASAAARRRGARRRCAGRTCSAGRARR